MPFFLHSSYVGEYDATKYAVVRSYEDIKNVTDVVVLTDFKNKGEVKDKGAE